MASLAALLLSGAACAAAQAQSAQVITFMFPGNAPPTDMVTSNLTDPLVQTGFVFDLVMEACRLAGVKCEAVHDRYTNCLDGDGAGGTYAGTGILAGFYDACSGFYDTFERRLAVDFGRPVLHPATAGLLVRLDPETKAPSVAPGEALSNKVVALVGGWSTTASSLARAVNDCTGERYDSSAETGFHTVVPFDVFGGPDEAMRALLGGSVDALFIEDNIVHDRVGCAPPACDASLWSGLGERFAFAHVGIPYLAGGITAAFAKKSSSLNAVLDPYLERAIQSRVYADLCRKYDLEHVCLDNVHINASSRRAILPRSASMSCESGVCACDVRV